MWAYLFNCIQQIWWKNLQNFELGTCQLFLLCCPTSLKIENLAPWVLPWIPPWPLPYHGFSHSSQTLWVPWVLPWNLPWPLPYYGFSHRSQTLWVPWVMPWNPQLFSLSSWFKVNIISASSPHYQCIITASSAHQQPNNSTSSAHQQRIMSASSAHYKRIASENHQPINSAQWFLFKNARGTLFRPWVLHCLLWIVSP